jgi:hypothetical protein
MLEVVHLMLVLLIQNHNDNNVHEVDIVSLDYKVTEHMQQYHRKLLSKLLHYEE